MTLSLNYRSPKPIIVSVGLASAVLCAMKTAADENRFDWSLYSETKYDNNNQLRSDDKIALSGTRLQTEMDYSKQSATDLFSTSVIAYSERYDRSEYDFEGYSFDTNYDWVGQTNNIYFDIGSKRQSTQVSEQTDTGRITSESSYRQDNTASLLWQKQLSRQYAIYLSTSAGDVDYESPLFADYESWNSTLGLQYQFNAMTTGQIQTSYERYESEFTQHNDPLQQTTTVDAKTSSYQFVLKHQFTEPLSFDVSAGQSSTKSHIEQSSHLLSQTIESESDGSLLILNASIIYRGEKNTASLEWSRNTQGSGSGSITEVSEAAIRFNRSLSPTSALTMHLQYIERENFIDSFSESTRQSREFYNLSVGLDKKVNKEFITRAKASYRTQQFNDSSEQPESYSVNVSLHYIPYSTLW